MGPAPDVVVLGAHGIGGNMVDVDHVPVPGESIIARNYRVFKDGGKGAHQAMVIGRLGGKAAFVGKLPKGPRGDIAAQWLVDDGVDIDHLFRDGTEPPHTGLIMIDRDGVSTIVSIPGSQHALTFPECEQAIRDLSSATMFITGFEIPSDTALKGAQLAKSLGMTTVLNPSPIAPQPLGRLDYIDVLVPNEAEARALLPHARTAPPAKLAAAIREQYAAGAVVITLGAEGVCACDRQSAWQVPALAVKAVCTTGAGDAFLGTLVWALIAGKEMREALHYANCAAGISASREGTIDSFATLPEVEAAVHTQSGQPLAT